MSAAASLHRKAHLALPFVGLVLVAVALIAFESDYFYRVQEQSLFLNTPLFFRQCMGVSGGLLSWGGAFLTQFFYHPALGICLLCACWAVLVLLLLVTFRIPSRWAVVTLVPVALLLLSDVTLGYWLFYLKLRGYFYVATLGTLAAVVLVWCYRCLSGINVKFSAAFIPLAVLVGYPLLGFYALLGAVLMAVLAWRIVGGRAALVASVLSLLSVLLVPLACYYTLYHETNLVNIYWTALPVFYVYKDYYPAYLLPYALLVVSLLAMAAFPIRTGRRPAPSWQRPLPGVLFLVLAAVVALFWYKDGNFHRELRMSRAIDRQDWEGVLAIAGESSAEPTRAICLMRNLALFRLGRQGDEMYRYPYGAARPAAPFPVRLVQTEGKMLYFQYGLLNFCYRWCIEDGVEYGWNVSQLKYLIKCSLLNNELKAAQKFISILRKTRYHDAWCAPYEAYVRNLILAADDPEIAPIVPMLKGDDNYLTSDNGDMERFMTEHFASAESSNPVYQEQALLAALQLKNIRLFWLRFYQYTEMHPGEQVPVHYQEAACLFGRLSDEVDTSRMPFDPAVVRRCDEFLAAAVDKDGRLKASASQLYDRFHDTYFYDYYFNK